MDDKWRGRSPFYSNGPANRIVATLGQAADLAVNGAGHGARIAANASRQQVTAHASYDIDANNGIAVQTRIAAPFNRPSLQQFAAKASDGANGFTVNVSSSGVSGTITLPQLDTLVAHRISLTGINISSVEPAPDVGEVLKLVDDQGVIEIVRTADSYVSRAKAIRRKISNASEGINALIVWGLSGNDRVVVTHELGGSASLARSRAVDVVITRSGSVINVQGNIDVWMDDRNGTSYHAACVSGTQGVNNMTVTGSWREVTGKIVLTASPTADLSISAAGNRVALRYDHRQGLGGSVIWDRSLLPSVQKMQMNIIEAGRIAVIGAAYDFGMRADRLKAVVADFVIGGSERIKASLTGSLQDFLGLGGKFTIALNRNGFSAIDITTRVFGQALGLAVDDRGQPTAGIGINGTRMTFNATGSPSQLQGKWSLMPGPPDTPSRNDSASIDVSIAPRTRQLNAVGDMHFEWDHDHNGVAASVFDGRIETNGRNFYVGLAIKNPFIPLDYADVKLYSAGGIEAGTLTLGDLDQATRVTLAVVRGRQLGYEGIQRFPNWYGNDLDLKFGHLLNNANSLSLTRRLEFGAGVTSVAKVTYSPATGNGDASLEGDRVKASVNLVNGLASSVAIEGAGQLNGAKWRGILEAERDKITLSNSLSSSDNKVVLNGKTTLFASGESQSSLGLTGRFNGNASIGIRVISTEPGVSLINLNEKGVSPNSTFEVEGKFNYLRFNTFSLSSQVGLSLKSGERPSGVLAFDVDDETLPGIRVRGFYNYLRANEGDLAIPEGYGGVITWYP